MNPLTFSLDNFLDTYEPIDSQKILSHYLKNKKLRHYAILNNNLYNDVVLGKTYIKYIKNEYSPGLKIYHGGILLSGGLYTKYGYKSCSDYKKWTHCMLKNKYTPAGIESKKEEYIFIIKISKYHLFYKLFSEEKSNRDMKKMFIDLC